MEDQLIPWIKKNISINEAETEILKKLFVKEDVKAKSFVLREGEVCNKSWLICKGILQFNINIDGEYRAFVFRKEGDFTSDMESFIGKTPSNKNIIALEDSILYSITYQNLQTLFRDLKQGERFGRLLAERAFLSSTGHFISYFTESPEARYVRLLTHEKDLLQRIPQYLIASYLGIKPQSLSRIKRKFAARHIS